MGNLHDILCWNDCVLIYEYVNVSEIKVVVFWYAYMFYKCDLDNGVISLVS